MRQVVIAAGVSALLVVTSCGSVPAHSGAQSPMTSETSCPAPPAADPGSADGWVGYLAAHPDDVSFIVEDGRGGRAEHRPREPAPAASALKVLHLAAYATAIDDGRVNPEQSVRLAEWDSWYLPELDGGAHVQALKELGIATEGPTDPTIEVRLDDVVTAMIRFSDNAAADLLRDLLGDGALREAAAAAGAPDTVLPSFLGAAIALVTGATATGQKSADRAAAEMELAQRYLTDRAYRDRVRATPPPTVEAQLAWAENTAAATAAALSAVHGNLSKQAADGSPGAITARRQLEWPPRPPGALGLGTKGGSYPGVLTEAMTLRRQDGTAASAVLMVRRMPVRDWSVALKSFAHQQLLLAAMDDISALDRVTCTAGGRSTMPG